MIANLRIRVPANIVFGDDESRERYIAEIEAALSRQRVRYAVAPRQRVVAQGGRVLESGAEITLEMLDGGDVPAQVRLARLIEKGIVLNREDAPGGPLYARNVG